MPPRTTLIVVAVAVAAADRRVALAGGGGTGLVPEAGTGQDGRSALASLSCRRTSAGPPAFDGATLDGPGSTWPVCAASPWC